MYYRDDYIPILKSMHLNKNPAKQHMEKVTLQIYLFFLYSFIASICFCSLFFLPFLLLCLQVINFSMFYILYLVYLFILCSFCIENGMSLQNNTADIEFFKLLLGIYCIRWLSDLQLNHVKILLWGKLAW